MTNKNYTHLTLVVDRSGSMSSLAKEVSGSINELIKEQREVSSGMITISIAQFDDKYDLVEDFVPASYVNNYKLIPRGMTALNDSVFKAITETEQHINSLAPNDRPENVIVTIVTDGFENASQEVTNAQLKELIEELKSKGWNFVFMASNIDAKSTGQGYGISNTRSVNHSSAGYSSSYSSLSSTITQSRVAGVDFTQAWSEDEENN